MLNKFATAAIAASLAAGSLATMSTSARADGWGGRHVIEVDGGRDRAVHDDHRWRGFETYGRPRDDGYPRWRDHRSDRREHRREDRRDRKEVARGIAIGIGVLMLGLMAAEAGRHHGPRYDRYDY